MTLYYVVGSPGNLICTENYLKALEKVAGRRANIWQSFNSSKSAQDYLKKMNSKSNSYSVLRSSKTHQITERNL